MDDILQATISNIFLQTIFVDSNFIEVYSKDSI